MINYINIKNRKGSNQITWQHISKLPKELVQDWNRKYKPKIILVKDYEQELPTPWFRPFEPGDAWWKHRLYTHNFGIYDSDLQKMKCYLYSEYEGIKYYR
jgi:hypothetical protein